MSVRTTRLLAVFFYVMPLAILALMGCHSQCGSKCTPHGLWESPTIQATRALLLVNTPELHVLRVDGKIVGPSCIGRGGVREYYLPPGAHTLTASFRYQAPVSDRLIGAVEGKPLTLRHVFAMGHEYVAVYHEHAYPKPKAEYFLDRLALTLFAPGDSYWSMDIVDLADAPPDSEPEVKRAQLYCSFVKTVSADAGRGEF
jgi:hypothetical protein